MTNSAFIVVNSIIGLAIFFCCGYQAIRSKREEICAELIGYALMAGGSIWIVLSSLKGMIGVLPYIAINAGTAIFLVARAIVNFLNDRKGKYD